jgi:hypothetical protein
VVSPEERAKDERYHAIARAQLGEHAFASAWAEGRTMPVEQVIADALEAAVDVDQIHSGERA